MGPERAENARTLASVSERKGWTEEAYACNVLVASWPQIQAGAAALAAGGPAQAEWGCEIDAPSTLRGHGAPLGFGCAPSRVTLCR